MFIESLRVAYPKKGWELEETHFGALNLLVGASGVGKTRILEAILDLVNVSTGNLRSTESLVGLDEMDWAITFQANDAYRFEWTGRIREKEQRSMEEATLHFVEEHLVINGEEKVKRLDDGIIFEGTKIPRLTSLQSLMRVFVDDKAIRRALSGLRNIFEIEGFDFQYKREKGFFIPPPTIDPVRSSQENLISKLYYAYEMRGNDDTWNRILTAFQGIFPDILNIEIHTIPFVEEGKEWQLFDFQISEKGIGSYALYEMSEGMRKSLEIVAMLELCPDNALILIDEFENSLGPNCIDLVAEAVNSSERGLQFIITSHHPYIINRISQKYWKIITREGGKVSTHTAEEMGIGRSRHESYDQLVQLEAYQTGVLAK